MVGSLFGERVVGHTHSNTSIISGPMHRSTTQPNVECVMGILIARGQHVWPSDRHGDTAPNVGCVTGFLIARGQHVWPRDLHGDTATWLDGGQ